MKRREFITLLGGAASLFFCVNAAAQEPLPPVCTRRETKKARGVPGLSLTILEESSDQGALDAPLLPQGTNQARRGSRKRPDRRGLEPAARAVTTRRVMTN